MKKLHLVNIYFLSVICLVGIWCQQCPSYTITNFGQPNCTKKESNESSYYYLFDESSCLPTCIEYNPDGYAESDCPCPPGYECVKRCSGSKGPCVTNDDCPNGARDRCVERCGAGTGSCMAYHANTFDFSHTFYTAKFKPQCSNDYTWQAKQCKGGVSGRCMCYDGVGKRLFGQALYKDSSDMTCACSRKKADLIAAGKFYVTFHCDSKGNYEELQCDSGLCWCVKPQTGKLTSPVVPEKAMTKLPCYKESNIGNQYLRKCDSIQYAMAYIENKLKMRGMKYVNMGTIKCDGDGAYGVYNMSAGTARCTWRDGSVIGSWQSDASIDISTLNCNCARDYKMYGHQLTCSGSGNYYPIQSVINQNENYYYCVDSDGFPNTQMFSVKVDNCSAYY